jgi:hypothetical protein
MDSGHDHLAVGLPHSEIHGSTIARISPWLFAACYVLHRLLVPRHPPNALLRLISHFPSRTLRPEDRTAQLFKSPDGLGSHHGTSSRRSPGQPGHPRNSPSDTQRVQKPASAVAKSSRLSLRTDLRLQSVGHTLFTCQTTALGPYGPKASLRSSHKESPACFTDPNRPVRPAPRLEGWWRRTGLNRRPPACKAGALPLSYAPIFRGPLHARAPLAGTVLVGPGRFELPTSRLSSARSNQLSYEPGSVMNRRLIAREARPGGALVSDREGMRRRRHVFGIARLAPFVPRHREASSAGWPPGVSPGDRCLWSIARRREGLHEDRP